MLATPAATTANLLDAPYPVYDTDLLRQLLGRRLSARLRVLAVIGAHRFQEAKLINRVFPGLEHIYLFEPLAEPLASLQEAAARDRRIRVFPVAIAQNDGTADFHVTSNDGESSSLLAFGSHNQMFPQVRVLQTIKVPTRRLDSLLAEHGLAAPDVLLIDVQGAEYQVLSALSPELLAGVRLVYAEASTERVYAGGGLLPDVERLLAPRFVNLGFAPLGPDVPTHGNVVFGARDDVHDALALSTLGRLQTAWRHWRRRHKAQPAAPRADRS